MSTQNMNPRGAPDGGSQTTPPDSGRPTMSGGNNGGGFMPNVPLCSPGFGGPVVFDPSAFDSLQSEVEVFASEEGFASGSVCVYEPPLVAGSAPALYPRNGPRARIRWQSAPAVALWEIRLNRPGNPCVLRALTRETQWIIPTDLWRSLATSAGPIEFSVRGSSAGALVGASGSFEIAPVDAGGQLLFSAVTSARVSSSAPALLMGLQLGNDTAAEVLRPSAVQTESIPGEDGVFPRGQFACGDPPRPSCAEQPNDPACCDATGYDLGRVQCIGCHVVTPDARAVVFGDNWPAEEIAASIEPEALGALPVTVTAYASGLLKQPWLGTATFSPAHFSGGDRFVVTTYGLRPSPASTPYDPSPPTRFGLTWFNLEAENPQLPIPLSIPPQPPLVGQTEDAFQVRDLRNAAIGAAFGTAWGELATLGEARSIASPAWSHDGTTIAYVSTDVTTPYGAAAWSANVADVRLVPYADRQGGEPVALAGASDPNFLEYSPAYSPDDALIAFTRAPTPSTVTRCTPSEDASGVLSACPEQDLGANPDGPYYNRNGEIYVVQRAGGTPIRLNANDPVLCSGETARGSINSSAEWAPRVEQANGKRFYFLVFSSARQSSTAFAVPRSRLSPALSNKNSQIYLTAVVEDEATGVIETRPAIYLWPQGWVEGPGGSSTLVPTSNFDPSWTP
jgi:hypothetical protein